MKRFVHALWGEGTFRRFQGQPGPPSPARSFQRGRSPGQVPRSFRRRPPALAGACPPDHADRASNDAAAAPAGSPSFRFSDSSLPLAASSKGHVWCEAVSRPIALPATVSGSPSPIARANRIYPAVSSRLPGWSRGVNFHTPAWPGTARFARHSYANRALFGMSTTAATSSPGSTSALASTRSLHADSRRRASPALCQPAPCQ
jgi:hypothetical protein